MSLTRRLQEAAEKRKTQPVPTWPALDETRQPVIDLRGAHAQSADRVDTALVEPAAVDTCPRCGTRARIDINDRTRGVMHLSCPECFKMWQVNVGLDSHPPSTT